MKGNRVEGMEKGPSSDPPPGSGKDGNHGDTQEDVITWLEFTENTTFHGIKYIFDNKSFGFRRALWFLCVVLAVSVFGYAGIVRFLAYKGHKATVNMMVTYPVTLDFPAVTICNQNSQRLTKAVDYELYNYIDAFFSNDPHLERFGNLSHINTTEFVYDAAHRRDDFIDKCIWKKKDCRAQFRRVLTDAGICYTFTPKDRAVTSPGSRFGLRLILNVEQYEYMKNGQDDVGVKVLLHDTSERPQIRDQGFVVEPGKHTLVAIKKIQFSGLGKPFDVTSTTAEPIANCQMNCESAKEKKRCKCTNVYMPKNETDPPTCDLRKQFECIFTADNNSTSNTHCPCIAPSKRDSFEPRLSTALLSKYNINQVAFSQPDSRNVTTMKYIRASDTSQRAIATVRNKNIELIDTLWNHTKQLQSDLRRFSEILQNASTLTTYVGTLNIFDKSIRDEFTDTRVVTDKLFKARHEHFESLPDAPDLGMLYNMIDDMLRMFITFPALDTLVKCVSEEKIFPDQVLDRPNENDEDERYLCSNEPPSVNDEQEGSNDPQHQGPHTNMDGHQMTGDMDSSHHRPNQQPLNEKREIQSRDGSILKRYDSSSNFSTSSNFQSGLSNAFYGNSTYSSALYSFDSFHSFFSNLYNSTSSGSYYPSPSGSDYPSPTSEYYPDYSESSYSGDSQSASPSDSSFSDSYYPSPSESYYSFTTESGSESPSDTSNSLDSSNSLTTDSSDPYTSSDPHYSFTTPNYSSSTNPSYPSATDGTTHDTTETESTTVTTVTPGFTSTTSEYYPDYSESWYSGDSQSGWSSGDYSGEYSHSSYSSDGGMGSYSEGICSTEQCLSSASSTCITAAGELPALDEITMAAIEPACITVFTSYSSYTLAQQTTSSLFYYNVNSITNGDNGGYPDYSSYDPYDPDSYPHFPKPGPSADENNAWLNDNSSLEYAPKPPVTFPPAISGGCDRVAYLICDREGPPGPPGGHNVTQALSRFRARYMEEMAAIFSDKTELFSDQQVHKDCLVELDKIDRLTPDLEIVYEKIVNMKKAETVQELIDALGPITISSTQIRQVLDEAKAVDMGRCMWFKRYWSEIKGKIRAEADVTLYVQQAKQANVFLQSQPNEITLLGTSLNTIRSTLDNRIMSYFNQLMRFKNGTFEKSVLTEKYDTFQVKVDLTKIRTSLDDFMARARNWKQSLGMVDTHLTVWYKYILTSMMVPLVTDKTVKELPVVKATSGISSLKSTLDSVDKDPTKAYEVPGQVIKPLGGVPMTISQNLSDVLSALITAEGNVRDNLESYSKGNKIEDAFFMENFLQLDLYYPELSYQTIEYQEAFSFVSLLSEIGGFMGLLLGASVLTVCEVADFIFLQCVNACGLPNKSKK